MTYVLGFDTSAPGMSVDAAESGHHIYASRLYTQAGGGVNAITFWVENANGAVGNAGIYDDGQGDLASQPPLAQLHRLRDAE